MRAISFSAISCASSGVRAEIANSRSEEHTSELQSQSNLVCRLLLEKTKDVWPVLADHCAKPEPDGAAHRLVRPRCARPGAHHPRHHGTDRRALPGDGARLPLLHERL